MNDLDITVLTSPTHVLPDGKNTFSPTTATLIAGRSEAVLVDTQYRTEDVKAVGDRIEASGRQLTTIYATHAHADHYFGIQTLLGRFPSAEAVAAPEVADAIAGSAHDDAVSFGQMFPELATPPSTLPSPLRNRTIEIDGVPLVVLPAGQADIAPTAPLHIPSLDAVIAGDLVYNGIHAMLALGGPDQWQAWIDHLDRLAALEPRLVVAGHKKADAPDDAGPQLEETRRYIRDFAEIVEGGGDYQGVVGAMVAKYPTHGNLTTLKRSASVAVRRRDATAAVGTT